MASCDDLILPEAISWFICAFSPLCSSISCTSAACNSWVVQTRVFSSFNFGTFVVFAVLIPMIPPHVVAIRAHLRQQQIRRKLRFNSALVLPKNLCLRALNSASESRFLAVCGIALYDAALCRFVYRLKSGREKLLGCRDILRGKSFHERLSRVGERILAAQIEHVLPCGGTDRFLCGTGDCHVCQM